MTDPNADTLYSTDWLDVGKEPYFLSLPDEKAVLAEGRGAERKVEATSADAVEVNGCRLSKRRCEPRS